MKNKAQMVIFRSSGGHDHRNNTSLGGEAKLIPLNETPVDLIKIAEEAARVTKIDFAGVDIVQDSETGKYYLLEINRTPQFTSGSFVEEKTKLMRDILLDED